MTTQTPVPPEGRTHPVTLPGLFTTAAAFLTDFRHPEVHGDLSFICHRGSVQVQVCQHAGAAEFRRDLVGKAAEILSANARIHEHLHEGADPSIWGSYIAHGTYMETPVFVWTAVSPSEADRLGWGRDANVIPLPLDDDAAGGAR